MEVLYRLSYVGAALSLAPRLLLAVARSGPGVVTRTAPERREAERAVDERPARAGHRRHARAPADHRRLEAGDADPVRQVRHGRQLADADRAARVAAVQVAG